jgi:hypothetical protein
MMIGDDDVEQIVECLAGETETLKGTYPSAAFSTTNPTRPDLGSNPGRHSAKPETSRQNYGTTKQRLTDTFR